MRKALINVDYTYDFVAEQGKLTCGKPGQAIENKIVDITQSFLDKGDFVAFGIDAHHINDNYHPETKLFPPHNIKGTPGMELYGGLKDLFEQHQKDEHLFYFEKSRYSAFCGTNLELKLRERQITEVHIVGVCTDICVLHTAIDAYNKGFAIVIHKDAVASFNPEGHIWALGHFENTLGAKVI